MRPPLAIARHTPLFLLVLPRAHVPLSVALLPRAWAGAVFLPPAAREGRANLPPASASPPSPAPAPKALSPQRKRLAACTVAMVPRIVRLRCFSSLASPVPSPPASPTPEAHWGLRGGDSSRDEEALTR